MGHLLRLLVKRQVEEAPQGFKQKRYALSGFHGGKRLSEDRLKPEGMELRERETEKNQVLVMEIKALL